MTILGFAASAMIPIGQAVPAGNLTFRSGATIVAKEGIATAAGAGAKKLAKPKLGDVGTDGCAVLNDADVGSALKSGSKTFCADELVVRNTKFLSVDGNIDWEKWAPYEQRSLPYIENPNAYHKYEVIKPIENVTMSEIAPVFEQAGGGIQYELPYNIKKLRELGYIKEIK